MRDSGFGILLLLAPLASANNSIVFVTDLPSFSALAPCAGQAVQYVVGELTANDCQSAVTALESCACTKDQNSAAASSSISSLVLEYCANTASDDVTSASIVFSNYCNQGAGAAVVTQLANSNIVSQYISDLPAFALLGPCAGQALAYVVQGLTANDCPTGQAVLESCACTKNQNSLFVSKGINSAVLDYCGSTHSEDVTSAQGIFAGYCGLGNGTSSFPSTSDLAGDVTYYITDLPQFSSLAPCAASALSYEVLSQTNQDCLAAPAALVSCVCVKDQNSLGISSGIASAVGDYCDSTASDDVSSALSVFAYYCSAGHGQVNPQGVTASVTTTTLGSAVGASKTATGKNTIPTKTSSSTGNGAGPSAGSTSNPSSGQTSGGRSTPTGAIAGGAVGAVVFIILVLFAVYRYRRTRRYRGLGFGVAGPAEAGDYSSPPPDKVNYGKPELASKSISPVHSSILRKPVAVFGEREQPVSPIGFGGLNELQSTPGDRAEATGRTNAAEMQTTRDPLDVQNVQRPNKSEMPDRNLEALEMSATSGPFELHGHQEWRD